MLELHVVFCEGKNDRTFLQETMTYKLSIDPLRIGTYPTVRLLERDVQANRQKRISISEGGGFAQRVRTAVRFSRKFWGIDIPLTLGVFTDSDRGSLYDKYIIYLDRFLATPCKRHNIDPRIDRSDSEDKLTIDSGHQRVITTWTCRFLKT